MLRIFIEVLLPLLLPTALYLAWLWLSRRLGRVGSWRAAAVPWLWLLAAGALLLISVLTLVTVGFGTAERGLYVPPRLVNGQIIPGHVEPGPSR